MTIAQLPSHDAARLRAQSAERRRAVAALVAKVRTGQSLVETHGHAGSTYGLEPSGEAVDPEVARTAIFDRLVAPRADGLLDAGTSQTWGPN